MEWKSKLKEMFPNSSDNRINAALIVHAKDFDKAVEFVRADPNSKLLLVIEHYYFSSNEKIYDESHGL